MPATGLWLRQKLRVLREQPVGVQAVAAGTAVLVVAGLITLGGMALTGGDDDDGTGDESVAAVSPEDAAQGATPGESGGGTAEEGSATSLAPDGTPTGGGGTSSNNATGTGGGGGGSAANQPSSPTEPGATTTVPLKLTASDRGVTASTVRIVTPWFNIDQASKITGTTTDEPLEDAELVIKAIVAAVNKEGGIAGRNLAAQIEEFNPINEVDMRARCQRWTKEDQIFAVVDSEAWHSTHQLCITQENKTPLVSSFTSVTEFTRKGAPYLWWTGPSAEDVIPHWVGWARDGGYLATSKQTAVLLADRADDVVMKNVFKAAFSKIGITPADRCDKPTARVCFETIPFDNASAPPAALSAVSRMKPFVDNVMVVLPLTTFTFYLNAAETQDYYPQYLGSDIAQTLVVADSILGSQFPRALHKMRGPTYAYLGGPDEPHYEGAGEKRCNAMWKAAQPKAEVLDRAGVGMRWCQNILAFVEGARRATVANGGALTRGGWATAMGTIKGFDGGMTPKLSWAPGDASGADQLKIIELRTDNSCPGPRANPDDPTCFVETSGYEPIRRL